MRIANTVFFDLDGPILDVSEKYYRLYCDLLHDEGRQPLSKAEYWDRKRRCVPDEAILRCSGLEGWSEEFRELFRARIESVQYLAHDKIWPGVWEMLCGLASRSSLVLVTLRCSTELLTWELGSMKLLPLFHDVLSTAGNGTTHQRAATKASLVMRALGSPNPDAWFVGDTETDVCAGQLLGLRTAAVAFGIRSCERLAALSPDLILETPEIFLQWGRSSLP